MSLPLRVTGLSKRYASNHVLDGLDLSVEPGQAVALLGPNGAGKSTLIGCVCGGVIPDGGDVQIGGHDLVHAPILARGVLRYLAQETQLPAGLTGRELLEFHAEVFGDSGGSERAESLAGLGDAIEMLASTYSVGMRRRLAFAALSFGSARLYVLDEPFAGIDADSRTRLLAWLCERRAAGAGILLAAHAQDRGALDALDAREFQLV